MIKEFGSLLCEIYNDFKNTLGHRILRSYICFFIAWNWKSFYYPIWALFNDINFLIVISYVNTEKDRTFLTEFNWFDNNLATFNYLWIPLTTTIIFMISTPILGSLLLFYDSLISDKLKLIKIVRNANNKTAKEREELKQNKDLAKLRTESVKAEAGAEIERRKIEDNYEQQTNDLEKDQEKNKNAKEKNEDKEKELDELQEKQKLKFKQDAESFKEDNEKLEKLKAELEFQKIQYTSWNTYRLTDSEIRLSKSGPFWSEKLNTIQIKALKILAMQIQFGSHKTKMPLSELTRRLDLIDSKNELIIKLIKSLVYFKLITASNIETLSGDSVIDITSLGIAEQHHYDSETLKSKMESLINQENSETHYFTPMPAALIQYGIIHKCIERKFANVDNFYELPFNKSDIDNQLTILIESNIVELVKYLLEDPSDILNYEFNESYGQNYYEQLISENNFKPDQLINNKTHSNISIVDRQIINYIQNNKNGLTLDQIAIKFGEHQDFKNNIAALIILLEDLIVGNFIKKENNLYFYVDNDIDVNDEFTKTFGDKDFKLKQLLIEEQWFFSEANKTAKDIKFYENGLIHIKINYLHSYELNNLQLKLFDKNKQIKLTFPYVNGMFEILDDKGNQHYIVKQLITDGRSSRKGLVKIVPDQNPNNPNK